SMVTNCSIFCIHKAKGLPTGLDPTSWDLPQRVCTAAELKFYFESILRRGKKNYVRPNKNCNLSSWIDGCEPGWGCTADAGKEVDLQDAENFPSRTVDCQGCCPGFFCPRGLTCMIPCPLGAYCPQSTLNKTTGVCDPFYCRKGSTIQTKCLSKGSCKPNSTTQDITIFGAMLVVALSLVLLIIYNFSDQLLTNREKKQAKSREAAVRLAKETVQARERWRSAKDVAKKHAAGLQTSLTRTFSRKKSLSSHESSKGGGVPHPPEQHRADHPSEESGEKNTGSPTAEVGGDKKKKGGKHAHTQSQIFQYAYGQIEKEKALEQNSNNLSLSGVVAMATDEDLRQRPRIEIAFKDITLTLKGSKKKLLRSVSGKLMPGRVAAVMGPSGAGKTTLLSAIAGKATGCATTGTILINGKQEPIRAYKKIIGFVPQDDIVHGNLTVQENLWFNARCRLPVEMSQAEKVLVVERVIESLGLQPVRDSMVGTVEKRGISGGQRKRVNVGLEMVMEPSVLILDEPTSGLDSASYTLYNMFDDLILLAKGGMPVYHGPVKKVEEYFKGLGIVVPDRVNPPDYYIDILEGIVKLDTNAVNVKDLPLRWMLHNGYEVPRDMLQSSSGSESSLSGEAGGHAPQAEAKKSVLGELWGNLRDILGQKKDEYDYNKSSEDLSNRRTPGKLRQYKYYLGRCGKQRLRESSIQGVDFLILGLAGICLGTLAKVSDESFGALGYTYTVIAVSLLCMIGALRSFSLEKIHYWRERAAGMSSLAYFMSKDTIDHFNTIVKPIVYLSMFYFFNNPRSSIWENYVVLVAVVYCVTGIGYTFAIFFQPGSAQLWSALLPVVLTLFSNEQKDSVFANLCYTKWALEAFVIANAQRYSGVWLITRCGSLVKMGYDIDHKITCILVLAANGIVFRCI
uniref:ABC transporter domain-containing protein n=1 Tax=Aegilops tauschii subsp. strangulata TaxID=200361 RepID=A0A453TF01_AEGTS